MRNELEELMDELARKPRQLVPVSPVLDPVTTYVTVTGEGLPNSAAAGQCRKGADQVPPPFLYQATEVRNETVWRQN